MDDVLMALYGSFYIRPDMAELKREVEAKRALLRDKLPAEQRKIMLRIVDDLTLMAGEGSLDSFLCGFKLAWQMANELNYYDDRHTTPVIQAGLGACSISREGLEKEKASSNSRFNHHVCGAVRPCMAAGRHGQKSARCSRSNGCEPSKRRYPRGRDVEGKRE